jgi:hypothetical protein
MSLIGFQSARDLKTTFVGPSPTLTLTTAALTSDSVVFAKYRNHRWWLDGQSYASGDVAGPVAGTFRLANVDGSRFGPYPSLVLVGSCLHGGDLILARAHGEKWYSYGDRQEYDMIVLT